MLQKKILIGTSLVLLALVSASRRVFAMEAMGDVPETDVSTKTWANTGQFSVLSTNGNSRATTFGGKDAFDYYWKRATLELSGDALQATSGQTVTAEQYDATEKVAWKLQGKSYAFERFAWGKNRFSGIDNQYNSTVGLGDYLLDMSSDTLLGELGPGYIYTQYTNDIPRASYASARAYLNYTHKLSSTASFVQGVEYLHDFSNSENYYLNTETALVATVTTHVSLKASFTWSRAGDPPPGFGKDDTITAMALVVNY